MQIDQGKFKQPKQQTTLPFTSNKEEIIDSMQKDIKIKLIEAKKEVRATMDAKFDEIKTQI